MTHIAVPRRERRESKAELSCVTRVFAPCHGSASCQAVYMYTGGGGLLVCYLKVALLFFFLKVQPAGIINILREKRGEKKKRVSVGGPVAESCIHTFAVLLV